MIEKFKGVIPAILSPTDAQGALSVKPIAKMIRFFRETGCEGVFVGGSSGEGFFLTEAERKRLAEAVVKECQGAMPAVIHVGQIDQRVAVSLAKHAGKIGAAGVSSVMPFYYGYTLQEARAYYQAIADASGLPLIIYVYSGASSIKFTPQAFVDEMCRIRSLVGIKYTVLSVHEMQAMQLLSGGRLRTFGGWDEIALPYLSMGCDGIIGTNYNYMPEPFVALYRAFRAGDMPAAMRAQERMTKVLLDFANISPVERAKAGCRVRGLDVGKPRPPMSWPTKETLAFMKKTLAAEGLRTIR